MARKDMINSIIGDGSSFKGTFIVKGSFQIDGKFEGELTIDGHLVIGPNGRVKTSTIITEKKHLVYLGERKEAGGDLSRFPSSGFCIIIFS